MEFQSFPVISFLHHQLDVLFYRLKYYVIKFFGLRFVEREQVWFHFWGRDATALVVLCGLLFLTNLTLGKGRGGRSAEVLWAVWPFIHLLLIWSHLQVNFTTDKQKVFMALIGLRSGHLLLHALTRPGRVDAEADYDWKFAEVKRHTGQVFPLVGFFILYVGRFTFLFLAGLNMYTAMGHDFLVVRGTNFAGLGLALLSAVLQSLADEQLAHFQRKPENRARVCDEGLWGWSRHPNMLFELGFWIGVWVFAGCDTIPGILGPIMLFFMIILAGIPMLEDHLSETKGEAWTAYVAKVRSSFLLVPPGWLARKA